MTIIVNGRTREVSGISTLGQLVDEQAPDRRGVAVAIDGQVVPRAAWDATGLHPGARVEILSAAQGG